MSHSEEDSSELDKSVKKQECEAENSIEATTEENIAALNRNKEVH